MSIQARAAEASSLRSSISQLESQVTILEVTNIITPHILMGFHIREDSVQLGFAHSLAARGSGDQSGRARRSNNVWVEWMWHVQEDKAGMQRDMETLQHKRTAAEERCDALAKQGTHISI